MELTHFIDTLSNTLLSSHSNSEKIKIHIFNGLFQGIMADGHDKVLDAIPLLLEEGQKSIKPKNMAHIFMSNLNHYFYNFGHSTGDNEVLLMKFIKEHAPYDKYSKFLKARVEGNSAFINLLSSKRYHNLSYEEKQPIKEAHDFITQEYKTIFHQELIDSNKPTDLIFSMYENLVNAKSVYQFSEFIELIQEIKDKIPQGHKDNVFDQHNYYSSTLNNYYLARNCLLSPIKNHTQEYEKLFNILNIDLSLLYNNLDVSSINYFFKQGDSYFIEKSFSNLSSEKTTQAFEALCDIVNCKKGRGHKVVEKLVKMSVEEPEKVYIICMHLEDKIKKELNITDTKLNGYEAVLSFINKNLSKSKTLQNFESSINQMHKIQSIYEQNKLEQNVAITKSIEEPKKKMKI